MDKYRSASSHNFLQNCELLLKGKEKPIGTLSRHGGREVKKHGPGDWRPTGKTGTAKKRSIVASKRTSELDQAKSKSAEADAEISKLRVSFQDMYYKFGVTSEKGPKHVAMLDSSEYKLLRKKWVAVHEKSKKYRSEIKRLRVATASKPTSTQSIDRAQRLVDSAKAEEKAIEDTRKRLREELQRPQGPEPKWGERWDTALNQLNLVWRKLYRHERALSLLGQQDKGRKLRPSMESWLSAGRRPRATQAELAKMDFQKVKIPDYHYYGCVALSLATFKAGKAPSKANYKKYVDEVVEFAGENISWTRRKFQGQPTRFFRVMVNDIIPLYGKHGLEYHESKVGDKTFPRNCILRVVGLKSGHVAARINGVVRDGFDVRADPKHYQIVGYFTEKKKV